MNLVMRCLFEGGRYSAQPWDCAAPIRGRLLNGVRHLFDEIRYIYNNICIYTLENSTGTQILHHTGTYRIAGIFRGGLIFAVFAVN